VPRRATVLLADLDDTLFDHAHATRTALDTLRRLEPAWASLDGESFLAHHNEILEILHQEVLTGRMTVDAARIERFRRLLAAASPEDRGAAERAVEVAAAYRAAYERGWRVVPGATDLLLAARDRGMRIAVVTNNLQAEQELKMSRCGLTPLVDVLVTSERAGVAKPDARIFTTALDALDATAENAVMLGDAWPTDVMGAIAAGIRPVWFNWLGVSSPDPAVAEIRSLTPIDVVLRALA
jgi:HAD superfamily hydrolase (TIGR01549 family)